MYPTQSIERPFGINVFGSSVARIEPDIASLKFAVARLADHPKDAFREAREGAQSVRATLAQLGVSDVGSSRITLSQTFRYTGSEQRFVGYTAKVAFHVLLHDPDRMEAVLSGVVDAGANEVNSVHLQTSRLKEIRAEARQRALEAAREKAINYCKAAEVALGPVVHIEDLNPDILEMARGEHRMREAQPDDEEPLKAFDPGSIVVAAAVMVAFEIGR
ncbi:MAG: SIMPL domain-containing protein [Acidobacteria bacterium]|nr:SIMPL domain-containing protein [Acidobacteriota bacterium]